MVQVNVVDKVENAISLVLFNKLNGWDEVLNANLCEDVYFINKSDRLPPKMSSKPLFQPLERISVLPEALSEYKDPNRCQIRPQLPSFDKTAPN